MNFINAYLSYTDELESPGSFFLWSAYAAVSATLRDNCYLNLGSMNLYPNIYVVLLADSAEHRKGQGLAITHQILSGVGNTKLIRGRSSIQAILDDMAGTNQSTNKSLGALKGGSCIIVAEELAAAIVEDPSAVRILTDIYDFREEYTVNLKSTGKIHIKNNCVTMLAASNETYLKDVYNQGAIYGGLLGRTFLVKPNEFRAANSLLRVDPVKYDKKPLIASLTDIAKLKGKFLLHEEAIQVYETWYSNLRESYRLKKDRTGVIGRIHTGVLKLAMILAVGTKTCLEITKEDMQEAIEQCTTLIPNYESYAMVSGKSELADIGQMFLNDLIQCPDYTMDRKTFLAKHLGDTTPEQFKQLVQLLVDAGMIQEAYGIGYAAYSLTNQALAIYKLPPRDSSKRKTKRRQDDSGL
jgi:hypothetical protein